MGVDDQREVQLLVVRPFSAGGAPGSLRFAMVDAVWKGGRGKATYVWPKGPVPANLAARLRVKLLMPLQSDGKDELFTVSSCSPSFILDAQSSSVLFEIPKAAFSIVNTCSSNMTIKVFRVAIKAWKKASVEPVSLDPLKKSEKPEKLFFAPEDFTKSATGRANILTYLNSMIKDYQALFRPILDNKTGVVKVSKKLSVSLTEMQCRVPGYFNRYSKSHTHYKSLSQEMRSLSRLGFSTQSFVYYSDVFPICGRNE